MQTKYKLNHSLFIFGLMILFFSAAFPLVQAQTVAPGADGSRQEGLAAALNPDGSLRVGTGGSFDTSGYRMELTATGAPRFVQAPPACSGWDTQFSLPNGVDNGVFALAVSATNIYVGGSFTFAGSVAANRVAKFDTTTGVWSALGTGGGNGVNNFVGALAVSGNDLYVGGSFTTANVGGTTVAANRVARFNTTTGVWSALGTGGGNGVSGGVNSTVSALAVSGSDLYVGGSFTTANVGGTTVAANQVARFDTTTGVWSALGTGGGNGVSGGGVGGVSGVSALAVSGSDLYVGGYFTMANVGGTTVAANNVARFNTTTGVWSALGSGGGNGVNSVFRSVQVLAVSGSDLYVGGDFTRANVGGTTVAANNVARFNTTTGVWSALGTGGGNGVSRGGFGGVNSSVFALAVSGSDLYVGGVFTTANVGGTTVSVNQVAKVNTTTGAWSALGTGGGNGVDTRVFGVRALALSGSDLYVGGNFTTANVGGTTVAANNVARFNTTTGVWSALGTGGGNGVNNFVGALAVSATNIYVGGSFTFAGSVAANRVAKFDTTTGVWSALGTGGGNGVNDFVGALAVSGSDLYVGGSFTTANVGGTTVAANRVARFNTTTGVWSALGTGGGNGVNDFVGALAVSGSDLYVGGYFTTANVGGTTVAANKVARFDTTTGVWSALGTGGGNGVNDFVGALAVSGSDLYVGGDFTTANVGGTTVAANFVAKVNTTTGVWSALGTGGGNGVNSTGNGFFNDGVIALAVSGSDLYVGGYFTMANVGGTTVAANRVARFNTTTGVWSALGTGGGNGVSGYGVSALAVSGSDLYVGGDFTTANVGGTTVAANNVARFNTTTGVWSTLADMGGGNGVNDFVGALAVSGSDLYVGGYFILAGDNKPSANIGRFCSNARTRFDFDGDGKADIAVFRPSNGTWYLQQSTNGFTGLPFGIPSDKLVPADYDGDGKTDIAVYRNGTWFLQRSTAGFASIPFGLPDDIPQPADFDGDGKADIAVFRPSNGVWYVLNLANNQVTAVQFGIATDKPVVSDYDGDGKADYAVYRPEIGTWYMMQSTAGFGAIQFGIPTDKPVVGDYDGDGKADQAVYRPENGVWYLLRSRDGFTAIQFGIPTDLPVPADYDGDGKTDISVYRDGIWYLQNSTNGFSAIQFGLQGDKPIPNAFVP